MTFVRPFLAASLLAALWIGPAPAAHAARSYDNCTGFIESLPATITTQGTWCLRKDLSTAMNVGQAITVQANNVTIDCNDFKVGGLAAGPETMAQGIYATGQQNITVRNCNLRGFLNGIRIYQGGGHLVEDNRIDDSLYMGISVVGEGGMVRRNQVIGTGGTPYQNGATGISATADVLDNTVDGVFSNAANSYPVGIEVSRSGVEVRNNRVRALAVNGSGRAVGLLANSAGGITFADNRISSTAPVQGWGVIGGSSGFCTGNTVSRYSIALQSCQDAGGNASN